VFKYPIYTYKRCSLDSSSSRKLTAFATRLAVSSSHSGPSYTVLWSTFPKVVGNTCDSRPDSSGDVCPPIRLSRQHHFSEGHKTRSKDSNSSQTFHQANLPGPTRLWRTVLSKTCHTVHMVSPSLHLPPPFSTLAKKHASRRNGIAQVLGETTNRTSTRRRGEGERERESSGDGSELHDMMLLLLSWLLDSLELRFWNRTISTSSFRGR